MDMRPSIQFHGIFDLEFTPIQRLKRANGEWFSCRRLILRAENGERFEIGLFSPSSESLHPSIALSPEAEAVADREFAS